MIENKQIPQQREDSHGDKLALHLLRHAGVVGEQADTQRAAKFIGDRGEAEVVGQVDAGTQEGHKGQTTTQQVAQQQSSRAALGHQELLNERVIETSFSWVTGVMREENIRAQRGGVANVLRECRPRASTVPVWGKQSRGGHALCQSDGSIVTPVQLLHDEAEVRLQKRPCRKPPKQRRRVHQHRHQQQDVGEELHREEHLKQLISDG